MTPFPPPAPDDRRPAPTEPSTSAGSRRPLAIAALAIAALGVGGVVAGSQLVAAAADDSGDESDTPDQNDTDDGGGPTDDTEQPSNDDLEELTDIFDLDEDDLGGLLDLGGLFGLDELDLGGFDLGEFGTSFEEFDECMANELPDLEARVDDVFGDFDDALGDLLESGEWDAALGELLGDSVTVFDADSDDLLTVLDFGDGDGSITITRTDGAIEINTSGDVVTIDDGLSFEMPDFQMPEFESDPEVEAALEECEALLPDGGLFDIIGDVLGDE